MRINRINILLAFLKCRQETWNRIQGQKAIKKSKVHDYENLILYNILYVSYHMEHGAFHMIRDITVKSIFCSDTN